MTETIYKKIKELRMTKKMSQKELGEKIGLSQQAIALTEKGQRKLDIETIRKIAIALDVSVINLVGYENYSDMIEERKQDAFLEYLSSIGYEFEYDDYSYIIRRGEEEYEVRDYEYEKIQDNINNFSKFTVEQVLKFADKKED